MLESAVVGPVMKAFLTDSRKAPVLDWNHPNSTSFPMSISNSCCRIGHIERVRLTARPIPVKSEGKTLSTVHKSNCG